GGHPFYGCGEAASPEPCSANKEDLCLGHLLGKLMDERTAANALAPLAFEHPGGIDEQVASPLKGIPHLFYEFLPFPLFKVVDGEVKFGDRDSTHLPHQGAGSRQIVEIFCD